MDHTTTYPDSHWDEMPETFEGIIFRHKTFSIDTPAIETLWGNYAIITDQHELARNNYGENVTCKPEKEFYRCVSISIKDK